MAIHLPDELRAYLDKKESVSKSQRKRLHELARDYATRPADARELSARYVRRLINSGWPSGAGVQQQEREVTTSMQ